MSQKLYLRNFEQVIEYYKYNRKSMQINSVDFGILHHDESIAVDLMQYAEKYLIGKQFSIIIPHNSLGKLIGLFNAEYTVQIRKKSNIVNGAKAGVVGYDLGLEIEITDHDRKLLVSSFLIHKIIFC